MQYFCKSPFCFTTLNSNEQTYCTSCLIENQLKKTADDYKEISKYWITRNDSSSVANILSGKWNPETLYKTDIVETESKLTNNETNTEPLKLRDYKCEHKACECSRNNCTNSLNKKLSKLGCFCDICTTSNDKKEKFIRTKPLSTKYKKMKRGTNTKKSRKYDQKSSASQTEVTRQQSSSWGPGKFDCDLNCRPLLNTRKFKDNIIDHLAFTKDRRNLERGYMSDSNINLCRCDLRNQHSQTSNSFDILNARNYTNSKCAKCTACNLRDLSDFRNYNYKETHAPKTITDTIKIPVHTCIYPFELNDRLFAKNAFGDEKSRCSICDLPLVTGITDFVNKPGSGIQNFEWEYIKKREVLRKRLENYVPQMAVIQIPICVQERNHSVIPQIGGRNINQSSNGQQHRLNISLSKNKIYPRDSLALRFQKGMI